MVFVGLVGLKIWCQFDAFDYRSNQRRVAPTYTSPEDIQLEGEGVAEANGMTTGTHMATASFAAMRTRSRDPAGEDKTRGAVRSGMSSGQQSRSSSAKRRQMTPEEFLRRVEDFAAGLRNAEIPKDTDRASPFKDLLQRISPRGSPRAGSPVSNIKARVFHFQKTRVQKQIFY